MHPSEGGVSFSEFRPDNDAAVGNGLNGWLSTNNGSNIDVIIKEIELN